MVTALPLEIIEIIGTYLYAQSFRDYLHFRIVCKRFYLELSEIKSQAEFDVICKSRYRKDSFRIFKKCHLKCNLIGSQKFAEKAAEYADIECLSILENQEDVKLQNQEGLKKSNRQSLDFLELFFHSVNLNLQNSIAFLLCKVNPAAQDQKALKMAALQDHIQAVETLLKDERVDPNAALPYAASDNMERLLRKDLKNKRRYQVSKSRKKKSS